MQAALYIPEHRWSPLSLSDSSTFFFFCWVPHACFDYCLIPMLWAECNVTVLTGQKLIACCVTLGERWNLPSIPQTVPKFNYRWNADWYFHYSRLKKGQSRFANVHFLPRQHFIRCLKCWNNYISSWINNWFYNSPFLVLLWDPTWIFSLSHSGLICFILIQFIWIVLCLSVCLSICHTKYCIQIKYYNRIFTCF